MNGKDYYELEMKYSSQIIEEWNTLNNSDITDTDDIPSEFIDEFLQDKLADYNDYCYEMLRDMALEERQV